MRRIDTIIVHCTATKAGRDFHVSDVDAWHRERGYNGCGYHYIVALDGTIEVGRPIERVGAHCSGHNAHSIGIAYVGGLDANGRPADTRTEAQKRAIASLIWLLTLTTLRQGLGLIHVYGHHDFNPHKACPCFDAHAEYD